MNLEVFPFAGATLVLDAPKELLSRKFDASFAFAFDANPNAKFSGFMKTTATRHNLRAMAALLGIQITPIAGQIATFRGASKAALEELASFPWVTSLSKAQVIKTPER